MSTTSPETPPKTATQTATHADDDRLQHFGLDPSHTAVVGLQWGDEGKGQLVDLLTDSFDVVVRYNGGNNAGHSVHLGDQKFALHLLPSGILYPDKINVIGNGVVVDPSLETGILKEIAALNERDIDVTQRLRISDRAHMVMPYHKLEDKLYDLAIAQIGETLPIGTTGRGIGPCYADKALRSTAIRMGELLDLPRLKIKLKRVVMMKNLLLKALAEQCGEAFEPFVADDLFKLAESQAEKLGPHITDTFVLLHEAMRDGKRLLFEGANAALLDVDHGTYPFVTSSSTSVLGSGPGSGVPAANLKNVMGVAKMYTSRVGGGPHPTELEDKVGEHIRTKGNEFGTTTGRPRRCGWLDLTAVRYSAQLNGCTGLCTTGLSVLAGLKTLKVCVGYEYKGQRLDRFPADVEVLENATPIYEELPGFEGLTGNVQSFDELPPEAKAYIQKVEDFVGIPVKVVCVGPRRDQALPRNA